MKNMKKLLQKAMVFTLSAAMLVGTPMTASAAGLVDLYRVEDGWGNTIGNEDSSRTGTVSATETNSGVLSAKGVLQGLGLSETNVEINTDEVKTAADYPDLTAYLEWDGEVDKELNEKLLKSLRWDSSNTGVVAVKVPDGSYNGGSRETIKLVPKAAGTAEVTVSLQSSKYPEISQDFKATAKVTVVQYANGLKFEIPEEDAFSGNVLVLDDYVKTLVDGKEAKTADKITYAVINDGNKAVTLKNGVLTLKKQAENVVVRAMGKNDKVTADASFKISAGVNATKLTFSTTSDGATIKGAALTQLVNDGLTADVIAQVSGKKFESKEDKGKNAACTDKITWSSANENIVTVEPTSAMRFTEDKCTVKLSFKSAGKTQIIGKTSGGKSFKLNVTVNAELTGVEMEQSSESTLYTGQIVDLNNYVAKQRFEEKADSSNFKAEGLIKWDFTDKNMKKFAKLNAKTGVLEILPDLNKSGAPAEKVVKVKAVAAKDSKTGHTFKEKAEGENVITFALKPVNITSIFISKGENSDPLKDTWVSIESGGKQEPKNASDSISVGKTKTYALKAMGYIGDDSEKEEDVTMALGWTASGNGKTVKAAKSGNIGSITALKKGSSTVTVSGVTMKNNKPVAIKATFKEKINVPTKTIALSVKNSGIAVKYKGKTTTTAKQTVAITAKFDKGSDTKSGKNKNVKWSAVVTDKAGNLKSGAASIDEWTGKVTLNEGAYALGDKIRVTAKVTNGPSASIVLTVVKASKSVAFSGETVGKKGVEFESATADPQTASINVVLTDKSEVAPNKDGEIAEVTYTMNKEGIARITENKEDHTITIYPLAKGKVTINAKTSDGKTGKLNVTVK